MRRRRRWMTAPIITLAMLALPPTGAMAATSSAHSRAITVGVSGLSPFASCDSGKAQVNAEFEPWITARPGSPSDLAITWEQDRSTTGAARGGIIIARSGNGGRTWRPEAFPGITTCSGGPFSSAANPAVAYGKDGRLYAIAAGLTWGQSTAILVTTSKAGGPWSEPTTLVNDASPAYFNDRPSITPDPRDSQIAYAVWNRNRAGDNQNQLIFSRTTDGGQSWEPARSVYEPADKGAGTVGNQIVVLPDGTLVDAFYEGDFAVSGPPNPELAEHIRVIRSNDKGSSWSGPITIADAKLNTPVFPGTVNPAIGSGLVPDISVDARTGALYAVWGDAGLATSGSAVGLSASYDGGVKWTPAIRLEHTPDSELGGNGQAFLPQVDVASDGTVGVAYYDFRENTAAPGTPTSSWLLTCRGLRCARDRSYWRESGLAPSFDLEKAATWSGTPYLGTSIGLTHTSHRFNAGLVATNATPDNPQDIFLTSVPVR